MFIILTQGMFYYCIIQPSLQHITKLPAISGKNLCYLIIASVLIAAAGNIINDYFDLNIDRVNKPHKVVIEKVINRRWAIAWHIVLSGLGILLSFHVSKRTGLLWIGPANALSVLLLFIYSASLKKKFLIGNILVSLLTAWVILVLSLSQIELHRSLQASSSASRAIFKFGMVYAGFAFIISLIREVIKDMEDVDGDTRYGCKTMPIVWGLNAGKVFVAVWLIVLIASLSIIQFYTLQLGWIYSAVYCFFFIIIPLLLIFKRLYTAQTPGDFHKLSTAVKITMLSGIVSIAILKVYL